MNVEKVRRRVTLGLINCDLRIVSLSGLGSSSACYTTFHGAGKASKLGFDKYEKAAANYYESEGWTVLRLGHFALQGVAMLEDRSPESRLLGELMRQHLPSEAYDRITLHTKMKWKATALNGVDPRLFPMVFYPPDFLVVDKSKKNFRFAEVKGPSDRLGLRQANWFVHSLPEGWSFELLALVRDELPSGEVFIEAKGEREGPEFHDQFGDWLDKVEESERRRLLVAKRPTRRNRR